MVQRTMLTLEYSRSSSVHVFAELKARMLAMRKHEFGMIGLVPGDFQVKAMKGMKAITEAAIDMISANFGPLVSQRTMQATTKAAIKVSKLDHP